jgi:SH3 domain protein
MRRILVLLISVAVGAVAFSQSMKMVVDSEGNVLGRYVRTNDTTYTVGVQDYGNVPKAGNSVVTFRAVDGQGVVWNKTQGRINVRSIPSTRGKIIGQICYDEEVVPDTYNCLGKVNGWYRILINGKIGFVRADLCGWDGMDTF